MLKTDIGRLRLIAFLEGVSYLFLLFVAMPLKYMADLPVYVRISGTAHGGLFVLFAALLFLAWVNHRWSIKFAAIAFLASFIPFGTFWLDSKLKDKDEIKSTTIKKFIQN